MFNLMKSFALPMKAMIINQTDVITKRRRHYKNLRKILITLITGFGGDVSSFYICFIESLWYISCVNTRSQTYVKHVYCFVGWLVGCTIFG
uniref:Uncharacterized protein n=1 Tax=Glossina palpalis gambiensis TaxID=67801 RepID=A0A1B0BSQ8_9MUSC